MVAFSSSFRPVPLALRRGSARILGAVAALLLLCAGIAIGLAQVAGERGIAPAASSSDIEVTGVEVDVSEESGEIARQKAWRDAERLAWEKIEGPAISDGELSGLVSAIVIEREQIGPKRYIATLGVIFDRQRAERYLGGESRLRSSAPMLVLPVSVSAGAYTIFETRNPWQRAWANFNPGTSRIEYVRPSGAGGDSLLLDYGQVSRRSRAWWGIVLDQYSAADVIVPIARLKSQYPGGPVTGEFSARYGPDSIYLDGFEMTASSPRELPRMLAQAVERFDDIFERALAQGQLTPDPTLGLAGLGEVDPALQRLIDLGRAIRGREAAIAAGQGAQETGADQPDPAATQAVAELRLIVVQFTTPDASAYDAAIGAVRGTPGVRGTAVTSTAIGGTSVMNVSFGGTLEELAAALSARGFTVRQGTNALAISR